MKDSASISALHRGNKFTLSAGDEESNSNFRLANFLASSHFVQQYHRIVNFLKRIEGLCHDISIQSQSNLETDGKDYEKFNKEKSKIGRLKSLLHDLYQNPDQVNAKKVIQYSQTYGESDSHFCYDSSSNAQWSAEAKEFNSLFDQFISDLVEHSNPQKTSEKLRAKGSMTCFRKLAFNRCFRYGALLCLFAVSYFLVTLSFVSSFPATVSESVPSPPTSQEDSVLRYGDFVKIFGARSGTLVMHSKGYAMTMSGRQGDEAVLLQVVPFLEGGDDKAVLSSPLIGQPVLRRNHSVSLRVIRNNLFLRPRALVVVDQLTRSRTIAESIVFQAPAYPLRLIADDSDLADGPDRLEDARIFLGAEHPLGLQMIYVDGVERYEAYLIVREGSRATFAPLNPKESRQNLYFERSSVTK